MISKHPHQSHHYPMSSGWTNTCITTVKEHLHSRWTCTPFLPLESTPEPSSWEQHSWLSCPGQQSALPLLWGLPGVMADTPLSHMTQSSCLWPQGTLKGNQVTHVAHFHVFSLREQISSKLYLCCNLPYILQTTFNVRNKNDLMYFHIICMYIKEGALPALCLAFLAFSPSIM